MEWSVSNMKNWLRKLYNPHALIVTVLIFAFIYVFQFFFLNMHFLDPFNYGVKDYEVTDIIFSQFKDPTEYGLVEEIILINAGPNPPRTRMDSLLRRIHQLEPAVVGLDILFSEEQDPVIDSTLQSTIKSFPKIILANTFKSYDAEKKKLADPEGCIPQFCEGQSVGYLNFVSEENTTVRLFAPTVKTDQGPYTSFSAKIAQAYAPERVDDLLRRKNKVEQINYIGSTLTGNFLKYDYRQLLDSAAFERILKQNQLAGKMVLIGFVGNHQPGDPELDRFFTPLNPKYTGRSLPDMYGIEIHANIIHMIMEGNYIYEVPTWLLEIIGWLYCYINVILIRRIYFQLPDTFHGLTRLVQIGEFLLIFFLIALLFYSFQVKIEFSRGILSMALAYDFVMIYESFIRKKVKHLQTF